MIDLIAQSPPPIDGVPSEFIKSAMQLGGFAIVIGLLVYNTFFKAQKREISGSITHAEVPEFADAEEVEELRHDVEQDKTVIGSRIAKIQQDFADNLHRLGVDTLKDLSELKSMVSGHEVKLEQIDKRLTALEKQHNDSVTRLHSRIDDAWKRGK